MKWPLQRCSVATRQRFVGPTLQFLFLFGLLLPATEVRAETSLPGQSAAQSFTGQFDVFAASQVSPLSRSPAVATNTELIQLEPALLAVSAERIKDSIWHDLGERDRWHGQIFLALHPAQSLDERVTIGSTRFVNVWNYRVDLPDVVSRTRLVRALTGVVLLELANRNAGGRSAEIPGWLVEGLSQQLLASGTTELTLSPPNRTVNGLAERRTDFNERGIDGLAQARQVLQAHSPLTFGQLNWPTDRQMGGGDGGIYRASAQLFVNELLELNNGRAKLRSMIEMLPQYYNWQTAFFKAFHQDFSTPVAVEKWWALQADDFVAHSPGPAWTPAMSSEKLNELLSVPVEMRASSNNLPVHAEISLQVVIRSFNPALRTDILQSRMRDLELAELRMAPQVAVLCEGYRQALGEYLGQSGNAQPSLQIKHPQTSSPRKNMDSVLKKLDDLDARRRTAESVMQPAAKAL